MTAQPAAVAFDDMFDNRKTKPGAARHFVGNLRLAQRLLEHLGLVVGAVQHAKVAEFLVWAAQWLSLIHI